MERKGRRAVAWGAKAEDPTRSPEPAQLLVLFLKLSAGEGRGKEGVFPLAVKNRNRKDQQRHL